MARKIDPQRAPKPQPKAGLHPQRVDSYAAIVIAARKGVPKHAYDMESEMLLVGAMLDRDTAAAREILRRCAECLRAKSDIPRVLGIYLSNALASIAAGNDPAQALHLKANARAKLTADTLLEIYTAVEWHKRNGAKSEKQAIKRAASQIGISGDTAEKRWKPAKKVLGDLRQLYSRVGQSLIPNPNIGQALTGSGPANPGDVISGLMIDLLGAPKKAR